MRTFRCQRCAQVLYFENTECMKCGATLAFFPESGQLHAVETAEEGHSLLWLEPHDATNARSAPPSYHCRNRKEYDACNWAVESTATAQHESPYCEACRLNEVVPDLSDESNLVRWRRLETAKRRLLYTIRCQLQLPLNQRSAAKELSFRFLSEQPATDNPVMTGHADGVITIKVEEADPSFREATREELGERYRTLLGHFRHESGHYYWDQLIANTERMEPFRALFGDERQDYQAAMAQHYQQLREVPGPDGFISEYAAMHPWEDWAETWAHYLHMVDTLETAQEHGLAFHPGPAHRGHSPLALHTLHFGDFDSLLSSWATVTLALNALSRSMGTRDPYPFALSERATDKLRFVHGVVLASRQAPNADPPPADKPPKRRARRAPATGTS